MNQDENDSKSYRKNDLIAVLKKDDKKDPIFLFKLSQNADTNSKKIKGVVYEKTETEKNKVNFEKGKNSAINFEDILASVAPNLPQDKSSKISKQSPEVNKYFLSKSNYSKLLNIALENIQLVEEKEDKDQPDNKSLIEIESKEDDNTDVKTRQRAKKISGPKSEKKEPDVASEPKEPKKRERKSTSKKQKNEEIQVEDEDEDNEKAEDIEVIDLSSTENASKPVKKIKKSAKTSEKVHPKPKKSKSKSGPKDVEEEEDQEEEKEKNDDQEEKEEEIDEDEKKPATTRKKRITKTKPAEKEKDEEEEDQTESPAGKKKKKKSAEKRSSTQKKGKVFQKGKYNNKIEFIEEKCEQFESKSLEIDDSCCVKCTNKEMVRATFTKNHRLLKKILDSQNAISTFYERWGTELNFNSIEIIFELEDKNALVELIDTLKSKKNYKFAILPNSTMKEITTGFNNAYAYGVQTRKVAAGRGGKEGNNALVYDINSEVTISQLSLQRILEKCQNIEMIDILRAAFPEFTSLIDNMISTCVRAGNYKLAGYLIGDLFKRGGYGFNKLHEEVLTLDDSTKLSPFKKTSTMKKTLGKHIVTPIHCAAINPNTEILKSLLESSQEFSVPDEKLRKPVHYAAVCQSDGPLRHLISCGVDTREGDQTKTTPLMLACQFGRTKNVECLLENETRANIGMKNRSSYAAIHYAAENGYSEILELLIDKNADVNFAGPSRMTPLHLASAHGHYECVESLLSHNAKILAKDKFKRNSLIMAVKNGNLKIASLLLQKGITFNEPDSSKNHPLHYAAAYGFIECIEILMKAGADPNVFNSWNLTPLTVAMQKNHFGCVKKLLSYKETDVNCKDDAGRTFVSLSINNINENIVDHLKFLVIEKKADLNIGDLKGWTPLHYACCLNGENIACSQVSNWDKLSEEEQEKYKGKYKGIILDIVKLFIENSNDINQISNDHKTCISIALQYENYDIAELFLNHPNFDVTNISQADSCIYHDLSSAIIDEKGRKLFRKVVDLMGNNNHKYINLIDHFGFTPILRFVENYSSYSVNFYNSRRRKLIEKKLAFLKKNKKKGQLLPEEEVSNTQPTQMGIPLFSTSGKMKKLTGFRQQQPLQPSNLGGIEEQQNGENGLSEAEINEITEEALKDFLKNENEVIEVIKKMISLGADIKKSVDQLKKYRENPALILEEQVQEKLKKDILPGVVKQKGRKAARRMIGSWNNDQLNQNQNKKRITPYGEEGLQNVMHFIMKCPTEKFLHFLFGLGIDFNQIDDQNRSPLSIFVEFNRESSLLDFAKGYKTNVEILKEILHFGLQTETRDLNGNSPIYISANKGKFDFVKVLSEYKANINTRNDKGEIPLIYWINQKNIKNAEFLLRIGADPNFADNKGRNALHHAVNMANADADASFEMESLLLKYGADINRLDKNQRTPLHYAFVKIGKPFENSMIDPVETVSSIMGIVGSKKNISDRWGKTPLHYAAQRGSNISGIYLLNSKEIDIEAKDCDNNTPLAVAFINKHSNFATLLIQNGANILSNLIHVPVRKEDQNQEYNNDPFGYNSNNYFNQFNINQALNDEEDVESDSDNKKEKMDLESKSVSSDESSLDNSPTNQPVIQNNNQWGMFGQPRKVRQFGMYGQPNQTQAEEDLKQGKEYSYFLAAIKYRWQGVSYLLIQQGYNIMNAIESALSEKKFQLVLTLLSKKSDKASFQNLNSKKYNLFHLFAIHGRDCSEEIMEKICRELKFREISINQKDGKSRIPLHYSAAKGFHKLSTYFLENNCDPEALDSHDNTPFSLLLQGNKNPKDYKFLTEFLQKGVNLAKLIKIKNLDIRMTPLIFLISQGEKNLGNIKWFLDHGSLINDKDSNGCTPLIYAIKLNSKKLLNFILSQPKFDKTLQKDFQDRNPIHYVVTPLEMGSYENIEMLNILAKHFDIKAKDSMGKDPMFYALNQDSGKMVNALIDLGAPKKVKDLARCGTSIITTIDWLEEEINVEEDAHKFIEKCIENDKSDKPQVEEKVKPDDYAQSNGALEVIYDDVLGAYDILMSKVDIKAGFYSENVFYKMQILYEKNRDVYILFNRWGRIGTEGQYQQTPFSTKEEVIKEFQKIFQQKSGNEWAQKNNFQKITKKYQLIKTEKRVNPKEYLIPFDYKNAAMLKCQLEVNIAKIMKLFSDVKMYQDAIVQFNLGASGNSLPLTSLDKSHLLEAKQILLEIADIIQQIQEEMKDFKKADINNILVLRETIASKSSRYYELVPSNQYSAELIPPIDNENTLNMHLGIVDSLLNFEITTKMLLAAHYNFFKKNPLDYVFSALNIRMLTLNQNDPEYKLISRYISNSHKVKSKLIKNIFALERKGEASQLEHYKNLSNKMLLWHGSKLQNYMGILFQGLRIAPPTAQVTGHAFGRGIYLADAFEKSWGYAQLDTTSEKYKFMLLCEVALGNMLEFTEFQPNIELDNKYQSVLGKGIQGPNFKQNIYLANGTIMPVGKLIDYEKDLPVKTRSLSYNEYIVYNENQVRIRYLIQLNSKYG